jgi:hypothetical protein
MQQGVDDECGEGIGVLCGRILACTGPVEGFAEQRVKDLANPTSQELMMTT